MTLVMPTREPSLAVVKKKPDMSNICRQREEREEAVRQE